MTAFGVPKYLVPSPVRVAQTLVADWGLLFALAARDAADHVLRLPVRDRARDAGRVRVRAEPARSRRASSPMPSCCRSRRSWPSRRSSSSGSKNTEVALVLCATIVAIFPIISNTTLGLRSVNPGLADLFRMNRATRLQTLVRLRIPSALPYFFGGLRDLERPRADRRGGGGVRRRHRRPRRGARLPDPAGRFPAQHPAPVRGALPDHRRGRRCSSSPWSWLSAARARPLARERAAR